MKTSKASKASKALKTQLAMQAIARDTEFNEATNKLSSGYGEAYLAQVHDLAQKRHAGPTFIDMVTVEAIFLGEIEELPNIYDSELKAAMTEVYNNYHGSVNSSFPMAALMANMPNDYTKRLELADLILNKFGAGLIKRHLLGGES